MELMMILFQIIVFFYYWPRLAIHLFEYYQVGQSQMTQNTTVTHNYYYLYCARYWSDCYRDRRLRSYAEADLWAWLVFVIFVVAVLFMCTWWPAWSATAVGAKYKPIERTRQEEESFSF